MRKLLLALFFAVCLLGLHEAKRNSDIENENKVQLLQKDSRSHKNNKKSHKDSRSDKIKKHQNNYKRRHDHHADQHHILHWNQPAFWWNVILAIFLSCAGGFFSGMTVGLNSLDKLTLEVQKITGTEEEKQKATTILDTIKDHHLFLVTLLVGNAMVLEYLPLVVHKLVPDWAAILISTFAVVIVAEIAPMSYTTGPSKYKAAYFCAPAVNFCIKIYWIIAYPIARGLDRLLGIHDDTHIKRNDFLAFVNDKKQNHLSPLEITMFNQLFIGPQFTSVQKIMINKNQVMVLCQTDEITEQVKKQILLNEVGIILIAKGTRDIENFSILTGIRTKQFVRKYLKKKAELKRQVLKINQFLELNPTDKQSQATFRKNLSKEAILTSDPEHKIPVVYSDTGLLDVWRILREKKSTVALIHRNKRRNQNTNLAFLGASEHVVEDDPRDQDNSNIIGLIVIERVLQEIIDFNNQITPKFEKEKSVSPARKRKLVKKASIVSAYSSSRSFQ